MHIADLVVGTFWFWILVAGANVSLLAWIKNECAGWATFGLVSALGALQLVFGVPIVERVMANPVLTAALAGGYLLAGTSWAAISWWLYVRKMRRMYDVRRAMFAAKHHLDATATIPADLKQDFWNFLKYPGIGSDLSSIELKPNVLEHKYQVCMWIGFWPWSMTWTLLDDPARRIVAWAYDMIRAALQRITDKAWAGTDQDLPR